MQEEVKLSQHQKEQVVNDHMDRQRKNAASEKLVDDSKDDKRGIAAALLATVADDGATVGKNPLLQEALLKMIQSLNRESDEKEAKRQEALDARNREHLANITNIREERHRRDATQRICDHRKEGNKGTRLGGQKLSNGHTAYLCNLCYKEFDETTVPMGLMPNPEHIGG